MTNPKEARDAANLARRENEPGAVFSSKGAPATSWFVPPLLVPIFLFALFLAHVVYQWGVS